MKKGLRIGLWLIALLLLVALLLPMFGPGLLRIGWAVAFGWLEFLKRVIPQASVSWGGVGMVLLCSILIVAGLHHLCAWLHRRRASGSTAAAPRWRRRWSLALYALLWLLFLAAMGVTGLTHQLGWLLTSNEPWTVQRKYHWVWLSELKQAAMEIWASADDADWDIATTQKLFFESDRIAYRRGTVLQEDLQVIFIPASSNKLAAAVLFFRDPEKRDKIGMMVVERGSKEDLKEISFAQLPSVLARYGNK